MSIRIKLSGHHVELTSALRDHVDTRTTRLARHFDHLLELHMILHVEKERHQAEGKIPLPGTTLFAEAVATDMYAAVDALVDKLDRQLIKYKEKHADHHQREAQKSALHQ